MTVSLFQRAILLAALAGIAAAARADDAMVDFEQQIAPILGQHCVRCHSASNREGEISLSTFDDLRSNEYVVAGDPDASFLIELVTTSGDERPTMPKDGEPLSESDVALLWQWINQGAVWPEATVVREPSKADGSWWSLQSLQADTSRTIDDFVLAELAEHDLTMNPPADRRTLIRRATYDLTGLPPSRQEVETFLLDSDPNAYTKLIDRLLQSSEYGERWGRHWLDVVRFGESNGYERNVVINELWPFRDYVIRSLNEDKPLNQFIREHIAGDVFGADDPDVAVGTAFLVAGPYDDVGNQDAVQAAQIRANTMDEIIRATSEAFLGITIGCARCHDHKFDPITQEDYYSLYATFAGVRHGAVPLSTPQARRQRDETLTPLNERKTALETEQKELTARILDRAGEKLAEYEASWTRPTVDRTGTEERFETVTAKFVRLVCLAQDVNPLAKTGFRIDEFEVWSDDPEPQNVALASRGGKASGEARQIEDFPDAYGPHHAIDGKTGAHFISVGSSLTIELPRPTPIDRVVFSSARGESSPAHDTFVFVAEYRIETSVDAEHWQQVANSDARRPFGDYQRDRQRTTSTTVPTPLEHRLLALETTADEAARQAQLARELAEVKRQIAKVPSPPSVWIGQRVEDDAKGPFHVFLGGSPEKPGNQVVPASLSILESRSSSGYRLESGAPESQRRLALADWLVREDNPLTPRVLANRVWHYHFGTGIVDTPSDFGYMGGRPSHGALLDYLAISLQGFEWRTKDMHRMIMTSAAYQQSSAYREDAAKVDSDSRLLWRFPPRRLSSEEIRDTMLKISGKLDGASGGPGFRLYHFMQDNVCTYMPLDEHGPDTYRRAVYHQNARASVVDLMTEFDQPDCTFSVPARAQTTTPLQALTMLNHSFTHDMSRALAERLQREAGKNLTGQVEHAYQLCYSRMPTDVELDACQELIREHGLAALCRVLLNTSEMIYVN